MGDLFPYEVSYMTIEEAKQDPTFQQLHGVIKPDWLEVFVEAQLLNDFPDTVIVDFAQLNEIDFPFIPLMPNPMEEYHFFQGESS